MSYGYLEKRSDTHIALCGEIHFDNVQTLWQNGLHFLKTMTKIIVDLEGVKSGDSTLLALCVAWLRTANSQRTQIQFINLPSFMQDVALVYEIDKVLTWAN